MSFIRMIINYYIKPAAIITIICMIIVFIICLLGNNLNFCSYGNGVFYSGLMTVLLSALSLIGNASIRYDTYSYLIRFQGKKNMQDMSMENINLISNRLYVLWVSIISLGMCTLISLYLVNIF